MIVFGSIKKVNSILYIGKKPLTYFILYLSMKKITIKRFKNQLKSNTTQVESSQDFPRKNKTPKQSNRFSCINIKQNLIPMPRYQFASPPNINNFCQPIEFTGRERLLRNMLESSDRKRSQILNILIRSNKKPLRTTMKKEQTLKKVTKMKTQEKQSKVYLINSERTRSHSRNSDFLQPTRMNQTRFSGPIQDLSIQRKRPFAKLTPKQSQFLKASFNKRIKEIKLRKYFQKDQFQSNQGNLLQSYGASLKGQKHHQNQDSIYFSQGIYVLCDGHGKNGKLVSNFVSQAIHRSLSQCLEENRIDETIILQTYRKIDLELENSNFDSSLSGCTCVALLRYQNNLFCISLGDSKAILCKGNNVCEISKSHKPDENHQKQRIENYGGIVRPTQITKDKFVGPMRIWAPGKNSWGPGLALSRAFGDRAARRYGLISTPEVNQIKLTSDEEFIVIGSDGLFDFFEDQEICRFVRKLLKDGNIPRDQIPNELVNEARTKWPSDSDDISCIIIFM